MDMLGTIGDLVRKIGELVGVWAPPTVGEMQNVTIFQQVNEVGPNHKELEIVSGARYRTSKSLVPNSQYCYLTADYLTAATQVTVVLATKEGSAAPQVMNLTDADAASVKLPLSFVVRMADRCRWV